MSAKTAVLLDMQKMVFSHPLRGLYDFAKDAENKLKFNFIKSKLGRLKRKYPDLAVIALDYATSQELEKRGVPHLCKSEVTEQFHDDESWNNTFKFMSEMQAHFDSLDPLMVHRGISLWEVNMAEVWRFYLTPVIKAVDSAHKILKEENISRLVIFDSTSVQQEAFSLVARKLGIEVIDKTPASIHLKKIAKSVLIKKISKMRANGMIKSMVPNVFPQERGGKKCLVFFYDHCGLEKVLPWASKVSGEYDKVCVGIDARNQVQAEVEKSGLRYEKLEEYSTPQIKKIVKKSRRDLLKIMQASFKSTELAKAFTYRSVPLFGISKNLFTFLFCERYLETIMRIELFNQMLDIETPVLVTPADDWSRYPNTLLCITKQRGIKSAVVRYGMLDQRPQGVPMNADAIMVYGETSRETLIKTGVPLDKVFTVGQAEGSSESAEGGENTKKMLAEFSLDPNKPIIVFAGGALPETFALHPYDIFYRTMGKNFSDKQIVSKLHPAEDFKVHQNLAKKYGLDKIIITKKYLFELLEECDALVTPKSTVAPQAQSYGKGIIFINTLKVPEYSMPKKVPGVVEIVYNDEELAGAINRVLAKSGAAETMQKAKQISKDFIKQRGEPAIQEVVNVINSLLKKIVL